MPENPKDKCEDGSLEEEQKERPYYYDDAHGYEEYEPEDEGDEADQEGDSKEAVQAHAPT